MNSCESCICRSGSIQCARTDCQKVKCRPNETLKRAPGDCCPKCFENDGICTVFGDPHYKTFDGKFYSFQGTCKYQLTADCVDHSFSIRVTNDGRSTRFSSWTKTVTFKMGGFKVNLGQKLRIKVNATRVQLPYKNGNYLHIYQKENDDLIVVETHLGIKLLWDGHNYIQVQVPVNYKNKLCGLCGNYNNAARDDLMTRKGANMTDLEVWQFAESWRVGGIQPCSRKKENLAKTPICRNKRNWGLCRPLKESMKFNNCDSILNPNNYFESCKKDMCECPSGGCFCDSFAAYARDCERLGVNLTSWRQKTHCTLGSSTASLQVHQSKTRHRKQNRKNHPQPTTPKQKFYVVQNSSSKRTPLPLN